MAQPQNWQKRLSSGVIPCLLLAAAALLALTHAPAAHAATGGKVILLTSIDGVEMARATPSYLFWARSKYYGLNAKLEKEFRDHFKSSGMEVEVFHYTDLSLLYQILHSPEYSAVYWVSHGADSPQDSIVGLGGIFDYQTFDMSPLLKEIHPNLKVLSIISCHSTKKLKHLVSQGELAQAHPGLNLLSYEAQVDASQGLNGALIKSDLLLAVAPHSHSGARCAERRSGVYVSVTRVCHQEGPALFLKSNDRIMAVLPSCRAGDTYPISGFVDLNSDDLADLEHGLLDPSVLDISINTGPQPVDRVMKSPEPYYGEISIRHPGPHEDQFSWKLLEKKNGENLGVNHRIFSYTGALPAAISVGIYRPFSRCQ